MKKAALVPLLGVVAACQASASNQPSDISKVLEEITRACSLYPYRLESRESGKVTINVLPNVRALPLSEDKKNCARLLVQERLRISMAEE